MTSNGNRTEWNPVRSVIIRVINKIGRLQSGSLICLISKFCCQLIIPLTKFVIYKGLFLNQNTRNSKIFFASSEKKLFMCAPDGTYCHIKAQIRAVDSQSDLRIL